MTIYDLIFLCAAAFFILMGVVKGGIRSIFTLVAFFVSILVAVWARPWLTKAFNLQASSSVLAMLAIGTLIFLGLRFAASGVSDALHKGTATNIADRFLGGAFGVVQVLVLFGALHFIFERVTPADKLPSAFTTAKVYPLTAWSSKVVSHFLPQTSEMASKMAPSKVAPDPTAH